MVTAGSSAQLSVSVKVRGARCIARKLGQLHLHLHALLLGWAAAAVWRWTLQRALPSCTPAKRCMPTSNPGERMGVHAARGLVNSFGSTAAGAAWASGSGCCFPSCRHPLLTPLWLQPFASVALPTASHLPQQRAAEWEPACLPGRPQHVARAAGHSMHSTRRHGVLRRWASVHSVTHLPEGG